MSMFGMLDCTKNFRMSHGGINCNFFKVMDDENHRINHCPKYKKRNLHNSSITFDFSLINWDENEIIEQVLEVVDELWDLGKGKNTMRMSYLLQFH